MGLVDQRLADRVILETTYSVAAGGVIAIPGASPDNGYTIELVNPVQAGPNSYSTLLFDGATAKSAGWIVGGAAHGASPTMNGTYTGVFCGVDGNGVGNISVVRIHPMLGGYQAIDVTMRQIAGYAWFLSTHGYYGDGSSRWGTLSIKWSNALTNRFIRVTEHVRR